MIDWNDPPDEYIFAHTIYEDLSETMGADHPETLRAEAELAAEYERQERGLSAPQIVGYLDDGRPITRREAEYRFILGLDIGRPTGSAS